MNTKSRILTGCMASGLTMLTGLAWAGPHAGPTVIFLTTAATGQAEAPANGDESRRQVAELLTRARQAMDEGNLQTADSLLSRAENMKVAFGMFYVGDTPKKVRRDLDRQFKAQGGDAVKKPSELFAAGAKEPAVKKPSAATDPFAGRNAAPRTAPPPVTGLEPPPADERPSPLADPDQFPDRSPFGRQQPSGPPPANEGDPRYDRYADRQPAADSSDQGLAAGGPREQSDRLLLSARRALAVGDVRQATEMVDQAKQLRFNYEFHDDSPAKVEAALQKYVGLSERDPRDKQSESYRRQYAEALMQQAEALIRWREFDEAERLAGDAQRMGVNYGPFDAQPKTVLERIAAARQAGGAQAQVAGEMEPLPPVEGAADRSANPADKQQVLKLVEQARAALAAGDLRQAEALAQQAEDLRVPDAAFTPQEDRPWLVLLQIQKQRRGGVTQAGAAAPIATEDQAPDRYAGERAVYDRTNDRTQNVPASSEETTSLGENDAMQLYLNGEEALRKHDAPAALDWFKKAYARRDELDPDLQQRLQDHMQFLAQPRAARRPAGESLLTEAAAAQQVQYRQVSAELSRQEELARQLREKNPKQALAMLQQARSIVEKSTLESTARDILLRRVDRGVEELEGYIESNRSQIDLAERNQAVRDDIKREGQVKVEVQEKLALLVNEFNTLMDERRFAEAEVVAKRAAELAPDELVVSQLKFQSKFAMRNYNSQSIRDQKENNFVAAMESVDESSIPLDDRKGYSFGDAKNWERLTKSRRQMLRDGRGKRTEKEIEIEQRLKTPVSCRFNEAPLSTVIDSLGKLAQVNVHLDQRGLAEEGVTTDTPITIDLSQDISLKSALNLILDPLHLSYVVKDEVLKITSEQLRDGEIYPQTYNVADLVIPIPNFVPSGNMGLAGALHDAQAGISGNWGGGGGSSPMPVVASTTGANGGAMYDPRVLAQLNSTTGSGMPTVGSTQPMGSGPGGLGGGAQPDFESLIELITSTIAPTTWDEVGGPGAIQEFAGNLSLVISQTQEVHEEIADLLEQLRRLQDLQVTIEVRFITLNDNFFERIGIDFDFDINDNLDKPFQIFGSRQNTDRIFTQPPGANTGPARDVQDRDLRASQSVTAGLSQPGVFSADLDIPFTQGSFPLAVPQFGNFAPGSGAQLGFAILSDLETYFFIEAAQGDRRSNVLQAPKVTLFNGQQAFVSDTSQSPFVISVIPVVGDFAAANQPVIVVLNEGTHLTVQAVVSSDRRFVRLTVVPFFSRIGKVDTFTFVGSSSTTDETDSEGPDDNPTSKAARRTTSSEGTTVQLPTFSFVTVTTTVSVPDGGTVLLGGIKRLSEGRNEFGVPMLNKLPYINRLFRNVGIGRETQSLMMMVTPRIIIQEEEEALLGIPTPP